MTSYAELQVTSNFSFLRGASHPEELVERAVALGHGAIAFTDRNTLAGVVRGHVMAKKTGLRFVVGARLDLQDGPSLLVYPKTRAAYGRLSRLISLGQLRAPKGQCRLMRADLAAHGEGLIAVALPPEEPDAGFADFARALTRDFDSTYIALSWLYRGDDAKRLRMIADLARGAGLALVATNDAIMHAPDRRPLADVLACIRDGVTIDHAGYRLAANAERHLKAPAEMARLFRAYPHAIEATQAIVAACGFSLDELRYEYPIDPTNAGRTPQEELAHLAWAGAAERYPAGVPAKVRDQITHELTLIGELNYAPYFLTVHDIVRFARSRGILCQGRGSAANSAVCFVTGITAVDPMTVDLLFERFVSSARNEPPDIDVDFEHERREEVIQYIYAKYGRAHAGLAATVISYRARSALREVGKAMGLGPDATDALARRVWGYDAGDFDLDFIRQAGLDPEEKRLRQVLSLARQLIGFPRHLSQHVGGFVCTRSRLDEVVPVANAAMADRTVIEWDKNDLDALGILKIDVLALGMLTCIRKAFALIAAHHGRALSLADVPQDDAAVYDMLCKADSIGVFQVESRAQMSMLPRLKPRTFYDLVIEVAIVRPGPIQGDMVHPYLRRRAGKEAVEFPSAALEAVLKKTLGVPLFQEQAMNIAIVAAGYTPGEADRLRRSMATFQRVGDMHLHREKFIGGMIANGYRRDFAERCFQQIEGFGSYGFPESHAASFALLVYVSAWIKCHYPAVFAAALLNSQPMGFYAPAQIVRDARDHGVGVRPVDVNASDWDSTLEPDGAALALRLGLRQVNGVGETEMRALVAARGHGYAGLQDMNRRVRLRRDTVVALAEADGFAGLGLPRRAALFAAGAIEQPLPLFAALDAAADRVPPLPRASAGEDVADDYASLRLSLKNHPLALLRAQVAALGAVPAASLATAPVDRPVTVAGLVLVRQQPGTAKGVIFMTLEDETGIANLIVWRDTFERFRPVVLGARLLLVRGELQREGLVTHIISKTLIDRSDLLRGLASDSLSPLLAPPLARADEVVKAVPDIRIRALPRSYPSRDFH